MAVSVKMRASVRFLKPHVQCARPDNAMIYVQNVQKAVKSERKQAQKQTNDDRKYMKESDRSTTIELIHRHLSILVHIVLQARPDRLLHRCTVLRI